MNPTIITSLLFFTLRTASILLLAAIGGIFCERTGVVNIALEGIMTMGAFAAVAVTLSTGNPWVGVLAGMLTGGLIAGLHGLVSIRFRANQTVSGVAINILAAGLSAFLMKSLFNTGGHLLLEGVPKLPDWSIPFVRDIPYVGTIIGKQTPGVYLAFIGVAVSSYVLFRTPLGLRIRAVGEHPKAADTVGVNVYRIRYFGVIVSGVMGGLAGAVLSIGTGNAFLEGMVSGRGFIAIAAMIFGKWHPVGAMWACLMFGLAEAIQVSASILGIGIPSTLMATFPYLLTMLTLAGLVGRSVAPAASGIPYEIDQG